MTIGDNCGLSYMYHHNNVGKSCLGKINSIVGCLYRVFFFHYCWCLFIIVGAFSIFHIPYAVISVIMPVSMFNMCIYHLGVYKL